MADSPATVAAIYVRVSDPHQRENYSLATQEAACRAYAEERGYAVSEEHVYRETHTATELTERPELTRARAAMERGEFNVLIFYDPDRFSRKTTHSAIMMYYCERANVRLEFALFDFENSTVGRYLLQTYVFAAELEHEKIKERTSRGKRARLAEGHLPGTARPLYGYRYGDATRAYLVECPETAIVVRDIYERARRGETLREIARALTLAGVPTPGRARKWAYTTVSGILSHPDYTGNATGTIPAIIDAATAAAVAARMGRNRAEAARHQRHPEVYLLRGGYALCGYCRRPLHGGWKTTRGRDCNRYAAYMAQARWHDGCAPGRHQFSVNAAALDRAVWADVWEYLGDPARLFERAGDDLAADPHAGLIAATERAILANQRKRANLARALALIDDDEAREPLLAELRAATTAERDQRAERDRQAAQQAAWQQRHDHRRDILALWRETGRGLLDSYAARRDALAALGVRAYVYADQEYELECAGSIRPRRALGGIVSECICATEHNRAEATLGAIVLRSRGPLRSG